MPDKKKPTSRRYLQRVSIRAERRTEPDWDRFAWAVLQHVRLKQAKKNPLNAATTTDHCLPTGHASSSIVNLTTLGRKGVRIADNDDE